ncbi:hypothetical protein INT46_003101 [Mucor plumbeus]|uniref:Retrotransposon gag domain-containing protein n=1 Tax=Mucor plumbeus TaxID=97098 RepID=A0A8H7V8Y0_9FUNG|nr:hypothetical protein INT46_003101 [Mucor plumbeus]
MSTPQERAKALSNKIADGSTEKLSHSDITSLQQLLQQLTLNSPSNNNQIREPKVNDPTVYTGVNIEGSNSLENFITQLDMVFRLQPSRFPDDISKVFYAASYMKDIAFKWIQPYIASVGTSSESPITRSYILFCDALRKMFGDVTLVSDAENKVMRMKQGAKTASEYTTEFKRYAVLTEFNEAALFWAYRNNINAQLQDELIVRSTPSNLQDYQDLVINLDLLMRERKCNKDFRNKKPYNNKPMHFQQRPPLYQQIKQHQHSDNDDVRPMEIDNTFRNQRKKNKKKYVPLTEAEKQRRNDLGLCVYCGSSDHDIENYNVKPAKTTLNAVYNVTRFSANPKSVRQTLGQLQQQPVQQSTITTLSINSIDSTTPENPHEHIIVDVSLQINKKQPTNLFQSKIYQNPNR